MARPSPHSYSGCILRSGRVERSNAPSEEQLPGVSAMGRDGRGPNPGADLFGAWVGWVYACPGHSQNR
jgi:hypothetical protein